MKIKLFNKNAVIPTKAHADDAGYDIRACIENPIKLWPGQRELIPTGFAIHINDASVAGLILPRSGLGHNKGIILGNSVGLIDAPYTGQWLVSAWNTSEIPFIINPGDKLCQVIFVPVVHPAFELVDDFDAETDRAGGGFGHTGI